MRKGIRGHLGAADHASFEGDSSQAATARKNMFGGRDYPADRRRSRHGRDHAPHRQEQNLRVALAGAVHGRREWLLRDKTRPSRILPLDAEVAERIIALTQSEPSNEATHWTGAAMAEAAGIQRLFGAAYLARPPFAAAPGFANSSCPRTPIFVPKLRDIVSLYVDPPAQAIVLSGIEKSQIQALTAPSPACR
jgi:hypothetical protein